MQSGGVISVGDARLRIMKHKEDEVEQAERALRRAKVAAKKPFKMVFKDAARAAKLRIKRLAAEKKAEAVCTKLAARKN